VNAETLTLPLFGVAAAKALHAIAKLTPDRPSIGCAWLHTGLGRCWATDGHVLAQFPLGWTPEQVAQFEERTRSKEWYILPEVLWAGKKGQELSLVFGDFDPFFCWRDEATGEERRLKASFGQFSPPTISGITSGSVKRSGSDSRPPDFQLDPELLRAAAAILFCSAPGLDQSPNIGLWFERDEHGAIDPKKPVTLAAGLGQYSGAMGLLMPCTINVNLRATA